MLFNALDGMHAKDKTLWKQLILIEVYLTKMLKIG